MVKSGTRRGLLGAFDKVDAKFYFTGENLHTFTKFEGLDPETGSTSNYPNVARFIFGLSITF